MRYRIRDFLWLALAMGVGLGWYVDRRVYTRPKPGWIDFENLGDYDPDYQFFEPSDSNDLSLESLYTGSGDAPPFEVRTRNCLDKQSQPFQILDSVDENAAGDLPAEFQFKGLGENWCGWGK